MTKSAKQIISEIHHFEDSKNLYRSLVLLDNGCKLSFEATRTEKEDVDGKYTTKNSIGNLESIEIYVKGDEDEDVDVLTVTLPLYSGNVQHIQDFAHTWG